MNCWRLLDCVSKNRTHTYCDAANAPVATVAELWDAPLGAPVLPEGYGPGSYAPGGGYIPLIQGFDGLLGNGGFGGFGAIGGAYGPVIFDAASGAWIGGDTPSPMAAIVLPVSVFAPSNEGAKDSTPLNVEDLAVPIGDTSTSTLQPLPVVPVAVPEPGMGAAFCLWAALTIAAFTFLKPPTDKDAPRGR